MARTKLEGAAPLRRGPPADTDTYSVYARFRRGRLALARRCSLRDALAFAARARSERLHDQDAVFVCHDVSGEMVEVASRPPEDTRGPDPMPQEGPAASTPARDPLHERAQRCLSASHAVRRDFVSAVRSLTLSLQVIEKAAGCLPRRH